MQWAPEHRTAGKPSSAARALRAARPLFAAAQWTTCCPGAEKPALDRQPSVTWPERTGRPQPRPSLCPRAEGRAPAAWAQAVQASASWPLPGGERGGVDRPPYRGPIPEARHAHSFVNAGLARRGAQLRGPRTAAPSSGDQLRSPLVLSGRCSRRRAHRAPRA